MKTKQRVAAVLGAIILGASLGGDVGASVALVLAIGWFWHMETR